jgi:hypothetical protein
VYNPSTQTANLFVDGIQRLTGFAGQAQAAGSLGLMMGAAFFNNGNGIVYHNLARLQIF